MPVETIIQYKEESEEIEAESLISAGLHEALGFIEDRFVRAKEGLNPEILGVVINPYDED